MLLVELSLRTAVPLLFAVATAIWLVAWRCRAAFDARRGPLVRALIAGLIIMIAGYAPFAFSAKAKAIRPSAARTFSGPQLVRASSPSASWDFLSGVSISLPPI